MPYSRTLDPGMAAAIARMKAISAGRPDRYTLPFPTARAQLLDERRWWLEEAPAVVVVREARAVVDSREVGLRTYRAQQSDAPGTMVYFHGGGWCVGSNDTHDSILRHLAVASGLDVVGVDYSLAPEHPFPAAVLEVAAVTARVVGGRPFVLAGDSAGANLALVEAMRRRDARERQACALVLFYGTYAPLRETGSAAAYGSGEFGLSIAVMRRYLEAYLGAPVAGGRMHDPRVYPALGALEGLPPTLLSAAQIDPLLDDTLQMGHRLGAAGNRVTMTVYPGVIHGFLSTTRMVERAREALAEAGRFAAAGAA